MPGSNSNKARASNHIGRCVALSSSAQAIGSARNEANVSLFARPAFFSCRKPRAWQPITSCTSSTAIPTSRMRVRVLSRDLYRESQPISLRSFSCFRCFLHTSTLASRFSPLASRFSLLASCPRSKPSDTFGYCPSTRCNKITRRNIGFWAFGEGDARARGAMLWRPVGPRA